MVQQEQLVVVVHMHLVDDMFVVVVVGIDWMVYMVLLVVERLGHLG